MPAGDAQRCRSSENDAWFFWLTCQSIFPNQRMFSPVRGTGPSVVIRSAKSLLYSVVACAWVAALLAPYTRCASVLIVDALGVAKNDFGVCAMAVPGKLRLFQS